jgi:hypothetical protein
LKTDGAFMLRGLRLVRNVPRFRRLPVRGLTLREYSRAGLEPANHQILSWYRLIMTLADDDRKVIYWHALPPLDAERSASMPSSDQQARARDLAHRGELWDECQQDLMRHVRDRLEQEVARLGGDYAHVMQESLETRRDDVRGEAWLYGRFTYLLLRRASTRP